MVHLYEFEKNNKKIVFMGVQHSSKISQIKEIEKEIEKLKPNVILIEGGYEKAEFSNEKEAILKGGEMGFTSYFAKKNKIILLQNDPSDKECIKFIEKNYGKEFTFLYFTLRNFSSLLKKDLPLSDEEKLKITLKDFEKKSEWKKYDYSFLNFKKIFSKKLNKIFVLGKKYSNYFNPNLNHSKTNKASKKLSEFRDEFMIKKANECLSKFKKIFVIKGESHISNNKKLFRKELRFFKTTY